jgi:hypothetical protein
MPVKGKIGYLKNRLQGAEKLSRDGNQDAYEYEAKHVYGMLREAWERALKEVLLGGWWNGTGPAFRRRGWPRFPTSQMRTAKRLRWQ